MEIKLIEITHDSIRYGDTICGKKNISIAGICRHIGLTPQIFNKRLVRNAVSIEVIEAVVDF